MIDPLKLIKREWKDCNDCGLGATAHNHVFYRGSIPCEVLFIGEAPGKDEDLVGEPFVGRAGDVLNALIEASVKEIERNILEAARPHIEALGYQLTGLLSKKDYSYGIANILACRPVGPNGKDRPPTKKEADACSYRLEQTIAAANPKLIILLGRSAEKHYKIPAGLEQVPAVYVEHPSFINRNGGIGSSKFDSVLLRLVNALERHLYGKETPVPKKAIYGPKSSRPRKKAPRSS